MNDKNLYKTQQIQKRNYVVWLKKYLTATVIRI